MQVERSEPLLELAIDGIDQEVGVPTLEVRTIALEQAVPSAALDALGKHRIENQAARCGQHETTAVARR